MKHEGTDATMAHKQTRKSISVSLAMYEQIKQVAKDQHSSSSQIVTQAVNEALDKLGVPRVAPTPKPLSKKAKRLRDEMIAKARGDGAAAQ